MKNKENIRVAVLIDAWYPFIGGGQVHVKKLTEALTSKCDFELFHATSTKRFSRLIWSIFVIFKVMKSHNKKNFNLIHAHAFIAGFPGKILSKIFNIPIVYTVHGSHTLDLNTLAKRRPDLINIKPSFWKYYLEKLLLTQIRYNHVISVSNNYLDYVNVNKNITIIPNGVDIEEFNSIKVAKRKQFSIIFIGKTGQIKGLDYLEKATEIVKEKHPDIKLVKVLGFISDKKKLIKAYKSSHLFVLPSLAEGQPISLLEAWAAKLPVVVTKVGDNNKFVQDGINGYLVPPANEKELAKTIVKAIEHPRLEDLGKAGYNLVKNQYTWKNAAEKTYKIYKEVLNGTG